MRHSAFVPRRFIPRIATAILAFAALLVLPGCWVYSVNPLYEENLAKPDPDLFFDQALLGSWWIPDDDCRRILTITANQQVYDLTSPPRRRSARAREDFEI